MKKNLILSTVFLFLTVLSSAQTYNTKNLQSQSFKAGGVNICIPAPDLDFVEISNEHRGLVELFVPQENRLLCAFALKDELPGLLDGDSDNTLTRYALVEVPRRAEYFDCESSDFIEVVNGLQEAFGDCKSAMQEGEDEFNRRMETLDLSEMKVKIGQPKMLGSFFSKQNAYASGMLVGYNMGGETIKMGATVILMRVKERLVFIYLYAEYENDKTILWLRNVSEKWSNEIISANKSNNLNIVSK